MRLSLFFSCVLSFQLAGVAFGDDDDGYSYPQIISMNVRAKSLKEHHTDFFKIDAGAVLRRGQSFEIEVEADQKLDVETMTINFEVNREESFNGAKFNATLVENLEGNKYLVEVTTDPKAPVGKYEDIVLFVQDATSSRNSSLPDVGSFLYDYPFPIYLIFNPWNPLDSEVYIANETMRQEHILHEYGNVYCGSLNSYDSVKWHYGQSNQITLDAAFHLLEKMNRTLAGNAIDVVQAIAHNQGMMRKKEGGILVGTEDALLEGNWGDHPFQNDTTPEFWTSTTDILMRWQKTGKPTQYGQCWVFAALQNALMRSIGVGARQISAFGAAIDMTKKDDPHHKNHHIVDEYYDKNGTTIYSYGQLWNFHSWNDILLERSVPKYSGWQSLDGTPPGLGPAPVRAIHDLDDNYDFNTTDVISTVHSTVRSFLVSCAPTHKKKLDGCTVEKQLKYDTKGLRLIVSTQTLTNGSLALLDITKQFIDPNTDAAIPFDDGKEGDHDKPIDPELIDELDFKVKPAAFGVVIGKAVEGVVEIKSNVTESMDLNIVITLETRTGQMVKSLSSTYQEIKLEKGKKQLIPYKVDAASYTQKNLEDFYIRVVATGESKNFHFFDKAILDIDAPEIKMVAPKQANKPFNVVASFSNPWPFKLENICITIHSHQLDFFQNKGDEITSETKCADLAPNGGTVSITSTFEAPTGTEKDSFYIMSTVKGDFIPFTQNHVEVSKKGNNVDVISVDETTLSSFA